MVANEKRKRNQLEELLRYTEDHLKAEQSQLHELRSRIETATTFSPQHPLSISTKTDITKSISAAQIMQLHDEIKNHHKKSRYSSETIQYSANTKFLFDDIKVQQSLLVDPQRKVDRIEVKSATPSIKPQSMQSMGDFNPMPHSSDSAYFSLDNAITLETTDNGTEEDDAEFSFRNSSLYIQFQNFIEQYQENRNESIPSLISDVDSDLRDSVESINYYFDSAFQLHTDSMAVTSQTPADFISRVEIEDIEPCLQFGRSDSHICVKTLMEHMKVAPCFIEPITLKEARNLPSPTNANSSAYYRPLWEKLVLSYVTPHQLECSACGNKCRASTSRTRHNEIYYRFRLKETEDWLFIDQNCRDRLVAVCDFYNFINNIRMGFYKQRPIHGLYLESIKLRLNIFYSRSV